MKKDNDKKTKLARAIATVLTGTSLTIGAASSASAATTMYNQYNHFGTTPCAPCIGPGNGVGGFTDGWVWGGPDPTTFTGAVSGGNPNAAAPGWVGTSGPTTTPFGYVAGASLNWAVHLNSATDSAEISNADSLTRYGVSADIDVAKGAWIDNTATPVGWKHDLDIGLFKSDITTQVKLSVHGVNFANTNFGITVFEGMSSDQTGYVHHGDWNANMNGTPVPTGIGFTAGDIVATTDTSGSTPINLNELVFNAQAGQIYTILIGGWRDGEWFTTNDGYVANFSAVPLPAGVWLFGSALAGLGVLRRRESSN
jgi:hypothetical protein